MNFLMAYIGDKGREVYGPFQWGPSNSDTPAENVTLVDVYEKYADYVKPKRNDIRATVRSNCHRQEPNE